MVSVIIPSYNRAALIKDSINSVLKQTYSDLEVIVVDDASTDNTEEVVKEIIDPRVKYIRLEKNAGACNARNVGVKHSQGELIAFQDSDDKWYEDKLEKQIEFLEANNYSFVFCGMMRIMLENPERKYYYPNIPFDNYKDSFEQLLYLNRVGTQTILCKKECFDKIQFDVSLKRFQDWDLALQASKYFNIGYQDVALVDSFVQKDSISKSKNANKKAWYALYEKYSSDIIKHPRIHAKYLFRLGNEIVSIEYKKAHKYYEDSIRIHATFPSICLYIISFFPLQSIILQILQTRNNSLFKKGK